MQLLQETLKTAQNVLQPAGIPVLRFYGLWHGSDLAG